MKFDLYKPQTMSRELWQAFADLRDANTLYDNPFFDPDYARLVGEVREDTRIGVASNGEDILGFWALHVRPGGWSRPIGGPFSDWHGPVLAARAALSPEAFLRGLGLSGMTVSALQPSSSVTPMKMHRSGANVSDLSQGWAPFLEQQQQNWPKHFKKMRRLYRNVDRDFSGISFQWDDRSDTAFDRLIELKRTQFDRTGLHDVLKPQWTQDLLDRLRHFEGRRFRARLSSLSYDDNRVAAEMVLQSDTVMHGWLTAYEPEYASYSPGNMLVQEMLQQMPEHGLTIYDAGPGLYHYKRHYSNMQIPLDTGVIRAASPMASPARAASLAWRCAESKLPAGAGLLMKRTRRRMDQIIMAETNLSDRMAGAIGALRHRPAV